MEIMKRITIKTMSLRNFKGISNKTIDFNKQCALIFGANGTGKTTIFDAYLWCLFGKDSSDRKQFAIKTLGKDGTPITHIPHEVEVVLQVSDETITLRRKYEEKWQHKRGSVTEEFIGHEETRYYNGVEVSAKEYSEKINALCDEEVLKMIANPRYFLSKKEDEQRTVLFGMVGDVSDEEIVANKEELKPILEVLQKQSVEEYKKEVSTKCKRVKDELKELPIRIKEVEYLINILPDAIGTLNTRIEELQNQIQTLNIELASYEKEAFLIEGFTKAKASVLTKKINGLFQNIKFKLFDTQVNGEEVECCKAMIDGVPHTDANNASRINAGLDIIQAISKFYNVWAPVFIDNAESVNHFLFINNQQIRFFVSRDEVLTVK